MTDNYTPAGIPQTANRQASVDTEGVKSTYRAGAVGQTLYSTAAAVLLEIKGSASAVVRIKRIAIWGQTGTKFYTELGMYRCTALSGGTPAAATIGKHDKSDGTATAVVNYYTGAATLGAGNAAMGAAPLATTPPAAGAVGPVPTVWDFTRSNDKALILRGTGDVIEIYNTITGLGTGTFGFEVEWEESSN